MDLIIESPKGSRAKYKYAEKNSLFRLHKLLPGALAFPFPFGFIPETKGEDGDPLDAFILCEFEGFPGCIMDCRIIGCICAKQGDGQKMIRNDRFLAIPEQSELFSNIISIDELEPTLVLFLENFLRVYQKLEGKEINLPGNLNSSSAMDLINKNKKNVYSFT